MIEYKMFIFPCAGGSSMNYSKWKDMDKNFDITMVEYPGHWERFGEELSVDLEELFSDVYNLVLNAIANNDKPIIFLGHSMGAIVAYHTACLLVEKKNISISKLVLLSCMPPTRLKKTFHFSNDEDIINFMKMIQNVPDKVLNSEFFTNNLFPPLKNDLKLLNEMYNFFEFRRKLLVDAVCVCGDSDPIVDFVEMHDWREYLDGKISFERYDGDHFLTNSYDFRNWLLSYIKE